MVVQTLLGIALLVVALFLILLVLVQRGRGGGLAGALGGAGGQSAFGTKAGDTFTRVTIVTAATWILLCMVSIKIMGGGTNMFNRTGGDTLAPNATAPDSTEGTDNTTVPPAGGGSEEENSGTSDE